MTYYRYSITIKYTRSIIAIVLQLRDRNITT